MLACPDLVVSVVYHFMRLKPIILLLAACAAAAFLSACNSVSVQVRDSVKILDVKAAAMPGSEYTSYHVKVGYSLGSTPHGKVLLGFDTDEPGSYKMVADQRVDQGTGEVELMADVKLPRRSVLSIYVNLSPDPHPVQWVPLANDTRQVRILK